MEHCIPIFMPDQVIKAFAVHAGDNGLGEKCKDILGELILHWIATTPAAPARSVAEIEAEYSAFTDADLYAPDPDPPARPARPAPPTLPPSAAAPSSLAAPAAVGSTTRGYQWKQLFLPNGTELRSIYCGRSVYATVEDEQLISAGLPTTPSRLANAQGCGTRNAWKTIWVHLPGSTRWLRADRCRDA